MTLKNMLRLKIQSKIAEIFLLNFCPSRSALSPKQLWIHTNPPPQSVLTEKFFLICGKRQKHLNLLWISSEFRKKCVQIREVFSKCHQKLIFIERDQIEKHLCAQGQQQLQVAPFRKLLRLTVNYNVKDECRASLWPVLDSSLFI